MAAGVIRQTLAAGGRNYHPLIARDGLSAAFVDPALRYIEARGGSVTFGARLRRLVLDPDRVAGLDFGDATIALAPDDGLILAVPPQAAGELVPGLSTPTQFRAIVNAHYRIEPPVGLAPMIGIVHGLAQWLFAFPGRLSRRSGFTNRVGAARADGGGRGRSPTVARGIAFLIRTQAQDGFWDEARYTATGFPRVFYLRYHGYSKFFPLWALARYRNLGKSGRGTTKFGM